jgi:hypothetical protein
MKRAAVMKRLVLVIAAATLFCASPLSLHWSPAKTPSLSVDRASARIGRPLTPMSVGVRTMARQQRARSVTAITTPPADAHTGTPVFAVVGTDKHIHRPA